MAKEIADKRAQELERIIRNADNSSMSQRLTELQVLSEQYKKDNAVPLTQVTSELSVLFDEKALVQILFLFYEERAKIMLPSALRSPLYKIVWSHYAQDKAGDEDVSKLLVQVKFDNGVTLASYAAMMGHDSSIILKDLIKHGDVNERGCEGETLLIRAVNGNCVANVKALIENRADLNVNSEQYIYNHSDPDLHRYATLTPLMIAANHGNLEMARMLIEHRANVSEDTSRGITALMLAMHPDTLYTKGDGRLWPIKEKHIGCPEIVTLLIENKAHLSTSSAPRALNWAKVRSSNLISYSLKDNSSTVISLLQDAIEQEKEVASSFEATSVNALSSYQQPISTAQIFFCFSSLALGQSVLTQEEIALVCRNGIINNLRLDSIRDLPVEGMRELIPSFTQEKLQYALELLQSIVNPATASSETQIEELSADDAEPSACAAAAASSAAAEAEVDMAGLSMKPQDSMSAFE